MCCAFLFRQVERHWFPCCWDFAWDSPDQASLTACGLQTRRGHGDYALCTQTYNGISLFIPHLVFNVSQVYPFLTWLLASSMHRRPLLSSALTRLNGRPQLTCKSWFCSFTPVTMIYPSGFIFTPAQVWGHDPCRKLLETRSTPPEETRQDRSCGGRRSWTKATWDKSWNCPQNH